MFERENYKAHAFICTECMYLDENNKPCAEDTAKNFRKKVKEMAKEKWNKEEVRINSSGCLDRCERAIAAVVYPQELWIEGLKSGDENKLLDLIDENLNS